MHKTAMNNGKLFFDTYSKAFGDHSATVYDIGSQDVNGSLKQVIPTHFKYIGVDFTHGNNVDVVLEDAYKFPIKSESADIVLSSSCFEHSEMFWLTFLEIMRILKPGGLFYLNAPSNGAYHRYPNDCWRFYPDSPYALAKWAKRNRINTVVLETYTSNKDEDIWNDHVAVFLKDDSFLPRFSDRILHTFKDYTNGRIGESNLMNNVAQW